MSTDPVKRSDDLDRKLQEHPDIDKSVKTLIEGSKRMRTLINLVIVSLVFEFFLTVAIAYVFSVAQYNKSNVVSNQKALVASCNAGNEFRKSNLVLWQYILNIPTDRVPTPEQTQRTQNFQAFLDKTFALRDCSNLSDTNL